MVADFAFMDVELLEVPVLEGMKETIKRSPNLIIVIEWSGKSQLWTQDVYIEHFSALLDWFETLNYKFWHPNLRLLKIEPQTCDKIKFIQMSKERFL